MIERKTRVPTQKRSVEKYEKIIETAFKLCNEIGYFNITTVDIAKEADVATGSLYSYFNDKKDIYIEIMKRISTNISEPTIDFWEQYRDLDFRDVENSKTIFYTFIKMMIAHHNFTKLFHDDMTALVILDKDIAALHEENTQKQLERAKKILSSFAVPFKNKESEKIFIHFLFLLIEDLCHATLYDKTIENLDSYVEQGSEMIYGLLINQMDINHYQ